VFRGSSQRTSYVSKSANPTGSTLPLPDWTKGCRRPSASMLSGSPRHSYIPKSTAQ
jgi:hypothetical protein